jgi:hypothetical protein
MSYHVICRGKALTVAAYTELTPEWQVRCSATDFLHEQSLDKNTASSCAGYLAIFTSLADMGWKGVTSAMTHEANKEEAIREFIKGSLRLLYFVDGDLIILTNGYVKKGQKADTRAVAEAVRIKSNYFKSKGKVK